MQQVSQPDPEALVRVELQADEKRPSYLVTVEAGSRGRIWSQSGLKMSDGSTIVLWLPGEILRAGSYELLLHSGEPRKAELLAAYVFRVAQR